MPRAPCELVHLSQACYCAFVTWTEASTYVERSKYEHNTRDALSIAASNKSETAARSLAALTLELSWDQDETALVRLWKEKRGEVEPEDLSGNLIVQLGQITEDLNRRWYERNAGEIIKDVQQRVQHPVNRWMMATLDGIVESSGAVFEAKFMLPWSFSEETAAEKHMAQLQHNMWVTNAKLAVLSIITGGGKWVEMTIPADSLYQHLLLTAERKFWRCVESGEPPRLFGVEPPRPSH